MPKQNGFSEIAALMFKYSDEVITLKNLLTSKYSETDLIDYLKNDEPMITRAAAIAIGLIGGMDIVPSLIEHLNNDDLHTSYNTEIALWNIWSRSGDETVDSLFKEGKNSLKNENFSKAVEQFTAVIEAAPNFAEAYNQRAIAYFMMENWDESKQDCLQTIELNPYHFGAYAGIGHVYLRLGDIRQAIEAYKQALVINPNLIAIAETLKQIHRELQQE